MSREHKVVKSEFGVSFVEYHVCPECGKEVNRTYDTSLMQAWDEKYGWIDLAYRGMLNRHYWCVCGWGEYQVF